MLRSNTVLVLLVAAVAGCGGEPAPVAAPPQPSAPPPAAAEPGPPPAVPRTGTGAAAADVRGVIDAWLRDLSAGDIDAAARRWALPSRFQNGTPVLTIDDAVERLAINASLPCGGRVLRATDGGGSYAIVDIGLRARPGGGPAAGCRGSVRSAVQVRDGRITALFRLPSGAAEPVAPGRLV